MPSFDIVSQVDQQEVKNAVEQTNKEITNRFDFKGSDARVEQAELVLTVYADDEFKLGQVLDVLRTRLAKRNVDVRALESGAIEKISGDKVKRPVTVKVGIAQDKAKQIQKLIKDSKLKVAASIQGDAVRISGGKKDDLQAAIQLVRKSVADVPIQFINFRGTGEFHPYPEGRRPAVVDLVRDLVQPIQARLEVALHFTRRLHRRALAVLGQLVGAAADPGAHQVRRHLHVALHAEMPAERERLVRAVLAFQHARRAGRNAEGLAVPLEGLERLQLAEPGARHAVVRDAHFAPADLAHRVGAHRAAESLRHELRAEAMADHRHIPAHRAAQHLEHRRDPGQLVVRAHRSAHHRQAAVGAHVPRYCLALVERDDFPRN